MSSAASAITLPVHRLFDEVWNQRKLDVLDAILMPDFVLNPGPQEIRGPAGVRQMISAFLAAFPDVMHQMDDLFAAGDKVTVRWHGQGTHRGEFAGIAATGKQMEYWGITICQIAGGRIAKGWVVADMLGLVQQLGGK